MFFKKNLVNYFEIMFLVLVNDGIFFSKVDIDFIDQDGVFQFKSVEGINVVMDDDYEGIYQYFSIIGIYKFVKCFFERFQ